MYPTTRKNKYNKTNKKLNKNRKFTKKRKYILKSKKLKNKKLNKNKKFTKKGGVEPNTKELGYLKHFIDISRRIKNEKLRRQIEEEILSKERSSDKREKLRRQIEEQILSKEKSSDKAQHRQHIFNKAFLEDQCSICLEDLDDDNSKTQLQKCLKCINKNDERIYFTIGCNHLFHGRCMDTWLAEDPTCPLCRESNR